MREEEYISVGELTRIIKNKFDSSSFFSRVYIKGEISNFKKQFPSGHCYLTIKDEYSRISAVMFNGKASSLAFEPKDGDSVYIIGKISVYEPNGNYQLYIEEMNLNGFGELYKRFIELKESLEKEGLFNPDIKKKIPKFPKKIGVVTASTGAAIKDIINTIKRRYPICEIILFPSLVQGADAYKDIVNKINVANTYDIDTLIVGRGGGSIEDLWPFNEKEVAYAIYNSRIPVISAVGHQIDFTISDFVADVRAATPTAAAELATPNLEEVNIYIDSMLDKINKNISYKLNKYKDILKRINDSYILKNPMNIYKIKKDYIKGIKLNISYMINKKIDGFKSNIKLLQKTPILVNPNIIYEKKSLLLNKYIEKLEILNPMSALKRGYSIIKKDNLSISKISKLHIDDIIDVEMSDGHVNAKVINIEKRK